MVRPSKPHTAPETGPLFEILIGSNQGDIEQYLAQESRLPGPRSNLELAHKFAKHAAQQTLAKDRVQSAFVFGLLDDWMTNPPRIHAPVDPDQIEFLPSVAALVAGYIAASNPEQWERCITLLTRAVQDDRWRVRELGATGMQQALAANWELAFATVIAWVESDNPLSVRGAVAAVAEPPLLASPHNVKGAVEVLRNAVTKMLKIPTPSRRHGDVRTLRKSLGYAISVIAVADHDGGVEILEMLARTDDIDAQWIVRENLKKARIRVLGTRVDDIRKRVASGVDPA